MATTNFDVVVNGVSAKTLAEEGGYRRQFIRAEIQQNVLSQGSVPALTSRQDLPKMYQTSWAGGARWWKPLISGPNVDSYFQSDHLDTWSKPGRIRPTNKLADAASTDIHDNCVIATDGTEVYAIGNTNTTDVNFRDVYKWTTASNSWVRETGYNSGAQDDSTPLHMAYDHSDGYFYLVSNTAAGGREVTRFNPATSADDAAWITGASAGKRGSSVLVTPFGLMYYVGGAVFLINKTGPAVSEAYNNGRVEFLAAWDGSDIVGNAPLTVTTPQGVYMVQNVMEQGQPVPNVFRVDRDAAGTYIGAPIAVLPVGSVALSVQFHMGQLLIATTPDWKGLLAGNKNVEIVIYYVGEGGKGALGSVLGGADVMDETPYKFLGSNGPLVYLAGQKRLWIYDAIRGGLHTAFEWETEKTNGGYTAMSRAIDSAGDEIELYLAADRTTYVKRPLVNNLDTVVAFSDPPNSSTAHYRLESSFFDSGLPMESKRITKVELLTDLMDRGDERWFLFMRADEGSYSLVLTHPVDQTGVKSEATFNDNNLDGYQHSYILVYESIDGDPMDVRALMVTSASGEIVQQWSLLLDGNELVANGELQDEQAFYDSMVTLAQTQTSVTFIDNMQEQDQVQDDTTGPTYVKVMECEIIKDKPGESIVRLVVREV